MPDAIPHEALARAVRAAFGAGARIVAAERLFGDASSRRGFGGRVGRSELVNFIEHVIERRHGRRLAADERAGLLAALDPLARPFEQGAPALVHRDFMAWILHVRDGRLHLIDFQDALLGPDAYDLAALLTDRTTGTLFTPALEAELIRHFVRARAAAALPVEGDLAARYHLCALHRALKGSGRFYYLELVPGKHGYLP